MLLPQKLDEEELVHELRALYWSCEMLLDNHYATHQQWNSDYSAILTAQEYAEKTLKAMGKGLSDL